MHQLCGLKPLKYTKYVCGFQSLIWHKISHHLLLSILLLVAWQQEDIFLCGIVLTKQFNKRDRRFNALLIHRQSLYTTMCFVVFKFIDFYGNWVETNLFATGDTISFWRLYYLERNLSLRKINVFTVIDIKNKNTMATLEQVWS